MTTSKWIFAFALIVLASTKLLAANASNEVPPAATLKDWPQYCGPNRDSVAVDSPKLLDSWPKAGPPLVWKSDWIPGLYQGGCSGPVVADGKVFVYATAKNPHGGGLTYKVITPEVLENAGWRTDLPLDLSKKIEDARTAKDRPAYRFWFWWEMKDAKEKAKGLDVFLAKHPDLDKYIKDFLATLRPEEAGKYGDYIKRRLCMNSKFGYRGSEDGFTWEQLSNISKLQGVGYTTLREFATQLMKISGDNPLAFHMDNYGFLVSAWERSFTRTDSIVCLDAATGKTLWKKDFPLDNEALTNLMTDLYYGVGRTMGVSGTPAVWGGKVFFSGAAGLYCLSTKEGALLWQVKGKPEHSSVLVTNGVVYFCGAAYHADTGRVLWKTPKWNDRGTQDGRRCASPSLWNSGGKTYIIAPDGGGSGNLIMCLDPETGKDLWQLKYTDSFFLLNIAIQRENDLFISEGKTFKLSVTGLQPVGTLVEHTPGMCFGPDRVIHQGCLYQTVGVSEGSVSKVNGYCCYDLKTSELKWTNKDIDLNNGIYVPSILADGKIIKVQGWVGNFMYANSTVTLIKATPEKYVQMGAFEPGLIPWTPIALARGLLFARTELGISCYDLREK